jgi:hypothetical protein
MPDTARARLPVDAIGGVRATAAATVLALEEDGPAIYNVVDDEPAPAREWLPVLADAL